MGLFDFFNKNDKDKVLGVQQETGIKCDASKQESSHEVSSNENYIRDAEMTINYGQVRTMADILIALDEVHHFQDAQAAINAVEGFVSSQSQGHFNISSMAFHVIAEALSRKESFESGRLNSSVIKSLFNKRAFEETWDNTMYKYYYAKLWKLICYFNDFRQYESPNQIKQDIESIIPFMGDYFVMSDSAWHVGGYPKWFFNRGINEMWNQIAPNNRLSKELLNHYMFDNHENAIRTIGLENTITRDFIPHYCHSNAYFPKEAGTAPVYVLQTDNKIRRFVKSCGEGIGPNAYPESLEIWLALPLLIEDEKYNVFAQAGAHGEYESLCFIPKIEDGDLPIYKSLFGKIEFNSIKDRNQFITSIKNEYWLVKNKIEDRRLKEFYTDGRRRFC